MGINIIVADDSSVVRTVIVKTLGLCNIDIDEIRQAVNGKQTLEMLSQNTADIIFTDINMPEMNGVELIQAIKGDPNWCKIPVVVISTEGSETRLNYVRELGVVDILRKPFTPEQLRGLLQNSKLVGGGE